MKHKKLTNMSDMSILSNLDWFHVLSLCSGLPYLSTCVRRHEPYCNFEWLQQFRLYEAMGWFICNDQSSNVLYIIVLLVFLITARKRSLGQGNVFTGVCYSFCLHRGWVCTKRGSASKGSASGGSASGGVGWTPHWILPDRVNQRAVHILLKCILVRKRFRT